MRKPWTQRQRTAAILALSIGAAVVVDQLATLTPAFVHLASVTHPERFSHGAVTDTVIRLSQHLGLINVHHAAYWTGTWWGDDIARLGIAWFCILLSFREMQSWLERYVMRTIYVLLAAAGISQSLSFATQNGVVDWLAITHGSGRVIAAATLSDLYVPLSLALIFYSGIASGVVGLTDAFVSWARPLANRKAMV